MGLSFGKSINKFLGADAKGAQAAYSDGGYKDMYGGDAIHSKEFTNQVGNNIIANQNKMVNGVNAGDAQATMNQQQNLSNPTMSAMNKKYGVNSNNVFNSAANDDRLLEGLNRSYNDVQNANNVNNQNYNLANNQQTAMASQKNGTNLFNAQSQQQAQMANNSILGGIGSAMTSGAINSFKNSLMACDKRLKKNIKLVETIKVGKENYNIYSFKYKNDKELEKMGLLNKLKNTLPDFDTKKTYYGCMAQELLFNRKVVNAVIGFRAENGAVYMLIDYAGLPKKVRDFVFEKNRGE
jgi:hypothetical protein